MRRFFVRGVGLGVGVGMSWAWNELAPVVAVQHVVHIGERDGPADGVLERGPQVMGRRDVTAPRPRAETPQDRRLVDRRQKGVPTPATPGSRQRLRAVRMVQADPLPDGRDGDLEETCHGRYVQGPAHDHPDGHPTSVLALVGRFTHPDLELLDG